MASNIPTDLLGVRDTLKTKYNIADENIGWNPNTNMVTLYGKDTIRPTSNVDGTTYAGQDVFNSASGSINALKQQNDLMSQYTNPQQQANPYDNQVASIISQLQNMASAQPQNVYGTPQYAAAQAQAQKGAQQATRQAQESLGSSGFGRSTRLMDRTQGIQNDANQYLETQLVPQIQAQLQAQQQAQMQNLAGILNALGGQQQLYDTRQQTQRSNLAGIVDFLTNQQQTEYANRQAERAANLDAAAKVGTQLGRVLQPKDDWSNLYNQTDAPLNLQGQELQRQTANDAITNDQWEREFASSEAYKRAQIEDMQAGRAISQANAARQAGNDSLANLYEVWDRTGIAPAGIPGVAEGTQLAAKGSSSGGGMTYNQKVSQLRQMYTTRGDNGQVSVTDPKALRDAIIANGASEAEIDQLLATFGLAQDPIYSGGR